MDYQSRQILFNGPMVQAILDGRKTQTRRVMKKAQFPCGTWANAVYPARDSGWIAWYPGDHRNLAEFTKTQYKEGFLCPCGIAGDRLWVREAWRIADLPYDDAPGIQYRVDGAEEWHDPIDPIYGWDEIKYEAWFERMTQQLIEDCEKAGLESDGDGAYSWDTETNPNRWRPSIHLPRWASRITLEVTGVRVERVQDISEEDAKAEGVDCMKWINHPKAEPSYRVFFWALWDKLNAKRGYGWNVNPWVWIVEFKVR